MATVSNMRRLATILLLTVMTAPVIAHHSFAQFDVSRSFVIDGTVTSFEWTNPHGWLWVAVPDISGGMQIWGAELKAPAGLVRDGWSKRTFNPGDKVTLYIHPMRDSTRAGEFVMAVMADGKVLQPAEGSPGGPVHDPQPPPGTVAAASLTK
jgi:Family of unknown function (DUF6152)